MSVYKDIYTGSGKFEGGAKGDFIKLQSVLAKKIVNDTGAKYREAVKVITVMRNHIKQTQGLENATEQLNEAKKMWNDIPANQKAQTAADLLSGFIKKQPKKSKAEDGRLSANRKPRTKKIQQRTQDIIDEFPLPEGGIPKKGTKKDLKALAEYFYNLGLKKGTQKEKTRMYAVKKYGLGKAQSMAEAIGKGKFSGGEDDYEDELKGGFLFDLIGKLFGKGIEEDMDGRFE